MTVKDVFAQTKNLSASAKAKLVDLILGDLDCRDPAVEKLWIKEVQQRKLNLRSGRTTSLSYGQVMGKYK